MSNPLVAAIDHLVYTVPELSQGMDYIEDLCGIRPQLGGHHPDYGTHNALLSLGSGTYLEIIAADPGTPNPPKGLPFHIGMSEEPRLATWALQTRSINAWVRSAVEKGFDYGPVLSGSRIRQDGILLEWRLTDPVMMPFGGAVPFLIDWGDTPHPSDSIPRMGTLTDFRIVHDHASDVNQTLAALGLEAIALQAECPQLIATILTSSGKTIELS